MEGRMNGWISAKFEVVFVVCQMYQWMDGRMDG